MNYDYIIYTDGSGNSSLIGGKACAIITEDGKTPTEVYYRQFEKKMTCNEAEYHAVLLALERLPSESKVKIITDSQLVVYQLHPEKPWKINFDHLRELNDSIKGLVNALDLKVTMEYIPRDHNLAGLFIEGKLRVNNDILYDVTEEVS
jgi:ribonuclease HI